MVTAAEHNKALLKELKRERDHAEALWRWKFGRHQEATDRAWDAMQEKLRRMEARSFHRGPSDDDYHR